MHKILVFIDWYLPGSNAGGPVRSIANMTENLADFFQFYIVTRNTDYCSEKPYEQIKPDVWTKRSKNIQIYYCSKKNITKKNFEHLILNTEFDSAYINGIYSYHFSIVPLLILRRLPKKIIVAPRGMLSPHALGVKTFKKKIFLIIAKLFSLYKNAHLHATNEEEASYIRQNLSAIKQVYVAENFPIKLPSYHSFPIEKQAGRLKLVSLARISPEKNTLFALQCLRLIKNTTVIFDLFGQIYDQNYWADCQRVIEELPANILVSYKGVLPAEKVHDTFAHYHFLYLPSRGENFGHSILESFLSGRPAIISNCTPWRNLAEKNIGVDLPLDNEQAFASYIEKMAAMEQKEYDLMSFHTLQFAEKHTNTENLIHIYNQIFTDA